MSDPATRTGLAVMLLIALPMLLQLVCLFAIVWLAIERRALRQSITAIKADRVKIEAVLTKHNSCLAHLHEDFMAVNHSAEWLLQFMRDAVNAAGAAKRFYDELSAKRSVPETELIELRDAIEAWQRSGRLN